MSARRPWAAFDMESSGVLPEFALQPWRFRQRKAWITTAAFTMPLAGGRKTVGKILPGPADMVPMLEAAVEGGWRVVTWNGTFDLAWLIAYGMRDLVYKVKWLDGMSLWKHLDITSSFATAEHTYSLKGGEKSAVGVFCPQHLGYEEDVDYHSQDPEEMKKLLRYNKADCERTLDVVDAIWNQLDSRRRAAAMIEARSMPLIADANVRGMWPNRGQVKAVAARMEAQRAEQLAELAPHGVTDKVVRSPLQLSKLMFDEWGLPDISGKRSTSKDVLAELAPDDDRLDKLRKFREALNLAGKFVGAIVNSVEYNGDGVTRPQAKVFGTYTSRLTYSSKQGKNKGERYIGFALHQMARDKGFRSMITAPPPDKRAPEGYDIVEADAAGQEFRWMAIFSGDETMLQLCQPGEDAHSFMGAAIAGRDYVELREAVKAKEELAGKQRQGGKVGNLSCQYRTSARTFRIRSLTDHGMRITMREADHIVSTYAKTYTGVPDYWRSQIQKGRALGYAETMAGRRVQVKGRWDGPSQWAMESTMINYPIQGTGGEQKYLALSVLMDVLPEYDARFAWDLHDGIYFYVPKSKSKAFAVRMQQVLNTLPYRRAWDFDPPIPLPWDVKIGPDWGKLQEFHG